MSYEHTVRSEDARDNYWKWCCDTLKIGEWKMKIGFMGNSATYCFSNPEDLTAFKLRFDITKKEENVRSTC